MQSTQPLVTEKDIETYERDGIVRLRGVIGPRWRELMAAGIERNMQAPGPRGGSLTPEDEPGSYFKDANVWQRIPEYVQLVNESPIGEIVGRLMGSRTARFFIETTLVKEPGTREIAPWHQDQGYMCIDGKHCATMWTCVDPVQAENGMAFVRGSHEFGKWYYPVDFFGDHRDREIRDAGFEPIPDIEAGSGDYDIVSWDFEPGDCFVFQGLTLHTSRPNLSSLRRRALATRWVGDDARYAVRDGMLSAPYPVPGFEHGDPFHGEQFPLVWEAGEGQ